MKHAPRAPLGDARWAERFRPRHAQDATVELCLEDGSVWRLDLLDISAGGVSFGIEQGQPPLVRGMRIDDAAVCVGETRIAGSLVVVHITEEFSAGTVCGAAFAPTSEADLAALDALIDELRRNRRSEFP